jgi:molecular chaperone GrpE
VTEKKDHPPVPHKAEAPKVDLEALQASAEEWQRKAMEYFDQILRFKAEFENFRKRVEREKAEARLWGKQDVLMPLIGIVDIFEQAMGQVQQAKDIKHVIQGMEMLHKSLGQFLKAEGLEPIETVGKPYDPEVAEVIERVEVDDESQVGMVVAEIQKGYQFQGRILRPGRVRVGVSKKEAENPEVQDA